MDPNNSQTTIPNVQSQTNSPTPQSVPESPVQDSSGRKNLFYILGGVILFVVIILVFLLILGRPSSDSGNITSNQSPTPTPTISQELQKAIDEAKESAKEYDNWQAQLRTDYMWLRRLPVGTQKYFVYFDLEKKKFVGEVYPSAGDDPEQLKREAISVLKDIKEIPVENYEFEWTITQ